jgi:dihydrofolate reductase
MIKLSELVKKPLVYLIYATDQNGVIGKDGGIPWRSSHDFAYFKSTTMFCDVIMGRKTWESLPVKARPLPDRHNIVVTSNLGYEAPGATVVNSLGEALAKCQKAHTFVIGGKALLEEAAPFATYAFVSRIGCKTPVDDTCVMAPSLPPHQLLAVKKLFDGDEQSPAVQVWCLAFPFPRSV